MERQIRTSAKAVVIRDGRLLVTRLNDGREEWYGLPGGGQDSEETLPETVVREVREETGVNVRCGDLLFVIEGVHGESFHRIDLVFSCEYLCDSKDALTHCDENQVGTEWIDVSVLDSLPLFPSRLRRPIMDYYWDRNYPQYLTREDRNLPRYLGNEQIGDPEYSD